MNLAMDDETREALRVVCARYGVSAAGLVEAFARHLTRAATTDLGGLPQNLVDVIVEARRVDAERKRR
jgi:hypothetical protein